VTTMRQRPVGGPLVATGVSYRTPVERRSCANTSPSWSSRTLPTYWARPPNDATPTIVLAAEPPDISMPGPMAPYSSRARASSTSCIVPLTRSCRRRKASPSWEMTSTSALPIPTTSSSSRSLTTSAPREIATDEQVQSFSRRRRERLRIRDHRTGEQPRALARPGRADRGDQPTQHFLRGRHVVQQIPDHGLDADRLVRLVPDVVVGDECERRVAQLGLAGE